GHAGRTIRGDVVTVIHDPPGSRLEKLAQELEDGRLARPVRTDQRMNGAAADLEADSLHRGEATELLGQPAGLENQIVQAQSLRSRPKPVLFLLPRYPNPAMRQGQPAGGRGRWRSRSKLGWPRSGSAPTVSCRPSPSNTTPGKS